MNISVLNTGPFGVNTLIVPLCENKVLVFDPAACNFTNDSNKITSFLSSNNLEPIAFILTHGHFDHITGTGIMKKAYPDVPLVCCKEDSIMVGQNAEYAQSYVLEQMGLENLCAALKTLPSPDILFSGEPVLSSLLKNISDKNLIAELNCWKALHTPGHTPGSVCWYNKNEKILISGDTVFFHSWGRTDLPGGSESLMAKSLKRIYSEIPDDVQVFPGHETVGFLLGENK